MDHTAAGMDVDVAAGVESRKYAPMSSGSARSAALETGGVVQIADTMPVSGATTRISAVVNSEKLLSWRRRGLVWATTSLSQLARKFWRRNSRNSKRSSMALRNSKAHRGQTTLDQQRIQTPQVRECKADGVAREPQRAKRNFESGL